MFRAIFRIPSRVYSATVHLSRARAPRNTPWAQSVLYTVIFDMDARASITCFRDRWTNSAHTCVACHAPCARFKSGGWGGRRMAVCCIRSTILSSYLPLPSSSFPSSSRRSFAACPLPPFSTAAPNNSKRYRTKIGVQNYATRGSGISSSADLAPAVSLVLMTRHPSRPSDFAQQSIPSPINKGS